jgi:hypothetical protein
MIFYDRMYEVIFKKELKMEPLEILRNIGTALAERPEYFVFIFVGLLLYTAGRISGHWVGIQKPPPALKPGWRGFINNIFTLLVFGAMIFFLVWLVSLRVTPS